MLTWRLWRALRSPDEDNPLFERVQAQGIDLPGKRLLRPLAPVMRVIGVLLPAVAVVIAPAALLLAANLLGALIAFNIMSTINREREGGTYDLLALTPIGLGAVNWLIAAACTQRLNAIERLAQFRTLALIMLILLMFYFFEDGTVTPIVILSLIVALNFDAIQSLITGCLCGMLAQEFSEQGAPFAALAIFSFVQVVAVYLPVCATAILLYDRIGRSPLDPQIADPLIALLALALLFLLREAIIQAMWRALERKLL